MCDPGSIEIYGAKYIKSNEWYQKYIFSTCMFLKKLKYISLNYFSDINIVGQKRKKAKRIWRVFYIYFLIPKSRKSTEIRKSFVHATHSRQFIGNMNTPI